MRYLGCFLILIQLNVVNAQFFNRFNSEQKDELTSWKGDSYNFIINEQGELQLKDSLPGSSCIFKEISQNNSRRWEFYLRMEFAPSSSNLYRHYLLADQLTTPDSCNGLYLQIGQSGNEDRLQVYHQTGKQHQLLHTGNALNFDQESNEVFLSIKRSAAEKWEVNSLSKHDQQFVPEIQFDFIPDTTWSQTGIYCQYTSSRKDKFYLDDIYVGDLHYPALPPPVIHLDISSPTITIRSPELLLLSDLRISVNDTKLNYHLDRSKFDCTFTPTTPLPLDSNLTLSFNSFQLLDNSIFDENTSLTIWSIQKGDLVINEIMSDPIPSLGYLPEIEYIEIFNTRSHAMDLKNWNLSIDNKIYDISQTILPSNQYLILRGTESSPLLGQFQTELTSFSLPNAKGELKLLDSSGNTIDSINYSNLGVDGYSYEKIDPYRNCQPAGNWARSQSAKGGTPGQINSIYSHLPDTEAPSLLAITVHAPDALRLHFSESITSPKLILESIINPSNTITSFSSIPNSHDYLAQLEAPLDSGVMYNLTLSQDIQDLCLNSIVSDEHSFILPFQPEFHDILISEWLPSTNDKYPPFIELFNNSSQTFTSDHIRIEFHGIDDTITIQSLDSRIFSSGDYHVFTKDKKALTEQFPQITPSQVSSLSDELPSWQSPFAIVIAGNKTIDSTVIELTESPETDQSIFRPIPYYSQWLTTPTAKMSTPGEAGSPYIEDAEKWISFSDNKINKQLEDPFSIKIISPFSASFLSFYFFNENGKIVSKWSPEAPLEKHLEYTIPLPEDLSSLPSGNYILVSELISDEGNRSMKKVISLIH